MSTYVKRPPAVIVGAGLNALGVLRSLATDGVASIVVDSDRMAPAMRSRHGRKFVYDAAGGDEALLHALAQIAAEYAPRRPVLILTMEETVALATAHYARLEAAYRLTFPAPDYIIPLLNKDGVRAAATRAGLAIPGTRRIRRIADLDHLSELAPPLVVKPAVRDASYGAAFDKAYRLDTVESARSLIERVLPVMDDLIVQEWIEGDDSDIYFCLQYLPPDGGDATSFVGRKIRSWPPRVGGTASCGPADDGDDIIAMTTAFFRSAGVHGLASMEYKREQHSGRFVVVEPTVGRTDFQEEVATLNGVNLPAVAYRDALGEYAPTVQRRARARVWRERMADARSAARMPVGSGRPIQRASIADALWRMSDPGPQIAQVVARIRARMKRITRRVD